MVLELNASDDRGIDVVREQIKTFASTKQIFSTAKSGSDSMATYKLIILDEADAMTSTAQMALRRVIEKYTSHCRFCIIANYSHKLSPALLSRCTRFRFSPLKEKDIKVLVDRVIEEENVNISPEATSALIRLSKGDMRRALNVLQACHASSKSIFNALNLRIIALISRPGTPLHIKGEPAPDEKSVVRDRITETTIYECIASPEPQDIDAIVNHLLKTSDVRSCLQLVNTLKQTKGLALADIVTAVSEELAKLDVPAQTMITWLDGLAEVEYRLSGGGNEVVQTGAMVGVVRSGVELMA
jgi:replication factor C subunit 3/5